MRARVLIYNPTLGALLLIHRNKNDRDYWVIPGGGAQGSETPIQTAQREIKEELDLTLMADKMTPMFAIDEDEKQVVFWTETQFSKTPVIHGEEVARSGRTNRYQPAWVALGKIETIDLMPAEAKSQLLRDLNQLES